MVIYSLHFYFEEEVGPWVSHPNSGDTIKEDGVAYRLIVKNGERNPFTFSFSQFESVPIPARNVKHLCLMNSLLGRLHVATPSKSSASEEEMNLKSRVIGIKYLHEALLLILLALSLLV